MLNSLKSFFRNSGLKRLFRRFSIRYNQSLIEKDVRYIGENLQLGKNVELSYPEFSILGKNVQIKEGAKLNNFGGIVIGDGAIIGQGAVLGKEEGGRQPIFIGKGARVKGNDYVAPDTFVKAEDLKDKQITQTKDLGSTQKITGAELGDKLVFIVSTGRAGSKTIARTLSLHPNISCRHEPNSLLIQLANDYLYGLRTREEVKRALACIYTECSIFPTHIYGESDQKLSFIIDILAELLPASKFVWLIRNAADFSYSASVNRIWYRQSARTKNQKYPLLREWSKSRISGVLAKQLSLEEWDAMGVHEKCCWYWAFCNQEIEKQLSCLDSDRWIRLKIEELEQKMPKLLSFLGAEEASIAGNKYNVGTPKNTNDFPNFEASLEKWCGQGMSKWYLE